MTNIIAITGKMHSGKSTVSALIMNAVRNDVVTENIKIAQPLYDMQKAIYDIVGLDIPYPKDRQLLQWLGTEWGRQKDEDLWINTWGRVASRKFSEGVQLILCDDLRYENEARKIKDSGGRILKIVANEGTINRRGMVSNASHPSERGIPESYVDACIVNEGSLHDLELQVKELLSFWEVL